MYIQVGTTSWKRNLVELSDLSPELKNELKELVEQRTTHYHTIAEKYLRLDEQVSFQIAKKLNPFKSFWISKKKKQPGFNVEDFSKRHGLLKFGFVRHPFDRFIWVFHIDASLVYFWMKIFFNFTQDHFCLWRQSVD